MSVNLSDFTEEQLKFAIVIFKESQDDSNRKLQALEHLRPGDVRHDLELSYTTELDVAILFRIQLENALQEVKDKNKVNSN